MNLTRIALATQRASDALYRGAPWLYRPLYDAYKRASERDEIALLERLVHPGDHVADVGANVGFYAALLAERVGRTGRVIAFEPCARNFDYLSRRARTLPQLQPVRAAVAREPGTITLHLAPHLNVDHRVYATDEVRPTEVVPAVSLDDYLAAAPAPLALVKMDIQGAEYEALQGMSAVVARSPSIRLVLEMWPFVLDRFGVGTGTLLELLASWGLDVHRLAAGGVAGELVRAETFRSDRFGPDDYFDVVCARPGVPC